MGWSEKYKKSIDCNNPKGFSQKAHCAGRKKRKNEMVFEEITEDILNEKLITYGSRKPYGQVVFIAGGAGSGKGFAISNFLDSSSFKIRDVDEMKKQLQILNRLGKITIKDILKKYGRNIKLKDLDAIRKVEKDGYTLQNLNLKNPEHVMVLHLLVKAMGIKEKTLEKLLMGKNNPEVLPNIMFDITAKDVTDITGVIPQLKQAGYKPENIHLTWVLTNYVTAMVNNKNRSRMVPEDILLKTHEGASNTVWGLVTKALPKGMNGRVDVILNNPQHTVFYTDADGKTISGGVKGFLSLPLKKEKGGIFPEKLWKDKLFNWVKDNAPESITANMKESIDEGMFSLIDQIRDESKNVKDFIKNVLSDRNFKDMKNDREFIKYLGSIYESVNEKMDLNDPMLVRLRAAQIKRNQAAADRLEKAKSDKEKEKAEKLAARNATKIKALKKKRAEVMRDMEQEAEPEGGKIADRYGKLLNRIDNDIIKLGGNPMTESINEWKLQLDLGKVNPSEFESWASDSLQKKHKIKVSGSGRNWTIVGKGNDDRMGSSADWISQLLGKAWTINKIKVVQKESLEERVNLFFEENCPTDASKWSYYKGQAKKKFDVYPSAYANGWAAKQYKAAGGGWKKCK